MSESNQCVKCNNVSDKIFEDKLCRRCHKNKLKHESYLRTREKTLAKGKIWREENLEHCNERDRLYHQEHKEKRNKQCKEYYEKNKERIKQQRSEFHKNNPENRKQQRQKQRQDINFKIEETLRRRARRCFQYGSRCMELLGCSISFLKEWFIYQFKLIDPNMTFENHGSYWEIDHVKPVASFDLKNEDDVKICFHWKNISPLQKDLNRKKSKNYTEQHLIEQRKRVDAFITYCEENNLNETLDTAVSSRDERQQ